jgi:hypothetical protein
MNKTRENVLMVSILINQSDEWFNVSSELCNVIWNYVYMPEDNITESIWKWKWMLGVSPGHLDMKLIKEDGYMFDWHDIIDNYKIPTNNQWNQMLNHYNNVKY